MGCEREDVSTRYRRKSEGRNQFRGENGGLNRHLTYSAIPTLPHIDTSSNGLISSRSNASSDKSNERSSLKRAMSEPAKTKEKMDEEGCHGGHMCSRFGRYDLPDRLRYYGGFPYSYWHPVIGGWHRPPPHYMYPYGNIYAGYPYTSPFWPQDLTPLQNSWNGRLESDDKQNSVSSSRSEDVDTYGSGGSI